MVGWELLHRKTFHDKNNSIEIHTYIGIELSRHVQILCQQVQKTACFQELTKEQQQQQQQQEQEPQPTHQPTEPKQPNQPSKPTNPPTQPNNHNNTIISKSQVSIIWIVTPAPTKVASKRNLQALGQMNMSVFFEETTTIH